MAQWPVLACFEIYCTSRGGPGDSVALAVCGGRDYQSTIWVSIMSRPTVFDSTLM